MKKTIFLLGLLSVTCISSFAQYKMITIVESIIPLGIGRSRIIEEKETVDYDNFTIDRVGGKKEKGKVSRKDIKIGNFSETTLLNFYSATGINFQNIASNDAVITSKLNAMDSAGWELVSMVSGVESDGGKQDGAGIYITRVLFKKKRK